MIALAAVASLLGVPIDVDRLFLQDDPAYVILIRAIVKKADAIRK